MAAAQGKEIKSRLTSIKNTKKITKAMELVSAAKMRRAVASALATRAYCTLMWDIMERVRPNVTLKANDPLARFLSPVSSKDNPSLRTIMVVFSSNRGLCGAFNTNVVKQVKKYIQAHPQEQIEVIGVGKKAVALLNILGVKVTEAYTKDDTAKSEAAVSELNSLLYDKFVQGKVDQVILAYTNYQSAIMQNPTLQTLFPFDKTSTINENVTDNRHNTPATTIEVPSTKVYTYEPGKYEILNYMIPRLAGVQLYQALLESNASEHSARMLAMKNATDAAKDMADSLLLAFNRARQASITQEIAEISAGTAAIT